MTVFLSTLSQMAFLLLLILIGYTLTKLKAIPHDTERTLSRLENMVFVPALVLGTFMQNFTIEKINVAWQYLLGGFAVGAISIPAAIFLSRRCSKDGYIQKIFTYGLSFSNFGFMGNAVVMAIFPDIFMEYLIFVLPLWMLIYLWGVPVLLIPNDGQKKGIKDRLRSFVNPMMIATLIGMILGLIAPPLPAFFSSAVTTLGNCMSPIAMLLTGMTIAKIDLKSTFTNLSIYAVSLLRLLAYPLVFILLCMVLKLPHGLAVCTVCSVAMPLGLNTIIVPNAYGRDTSVAAGMSLISHLLSCISIPLVFMLFDLLVA
ncbi:MAG: AEC family transporter [Clostridia bacterium]|nr:AEC family transporter [Clostridia bacterium]MBQ6803188.1 AEC family transporter [Clostridia bacterium]